MLDGSHGLAYNVTTVKITDRPKAGKDFEMKVYDKNTGVIIANILTNHPMYTEEVLSLMRYSVTDDGQIRDDDNGELLNAWFDDLVFDY